MKKQTMANIMKEKIDKDRIYKKVVTKIEDTKDLSRKKMMKLAAFVLFLSLIVMGIKKELKIESKSYHDTIAINIVNSSKTDGYYYDVIWKNEKISIEALSWEYPWIAKLQVPQRFQTKTASKLFTFLQPHDYIGNILTYREEACYLSIYFSEKGQKRPRCIPINEETLSSSWIGKVKVKIMRTIEGEYTIFFQLDDLWFDIETSGMKEEEVIMVVKSIIQSKPSWYRFFLFWKECSLEEIRKLSVVK